VIVGLCGCAFLGGVAAGAVGGGGAVTLLAGRLLNIRIIQ